MTGSTQPDPAPLPFDLSALEDDTSPETLTALYQDLDPNDPLLKNVERVLDIQQQGPGDGLESRLDDSESRGGALDPALMNWRIMAPDDPKGRLINARISDGLGKKVDHLIARTGGEVWNTPSDLFREAIFHYVRSVILALQSEDPVLTSILAEAELHGRAEFHETRRRRLEQAVDKVRDYLTDLVNLDDYDEAYRFLLDLAYRVRSIRVESWRRHWLLALNALPVLKITVRLLYANAWDIPVEFYPAGNISTVDGRAISPEILAPPVPSEEP